MNEHLWWIGGLFCVAGLLFLWTWWMISEKSSRHVARRLDQRVLEIEKRLGIEEDNCLRVTITGTKQTPPIVSTTASTHHTIGIDDKLVQRLDKIEDSATGAHAAALEAGEYAKDAAVNTQAIRSVLEGLKKPARKPAKKGGK